MHTTNNSADINYKLLNFDHSLPCDLSGSLSQINRGLSDKCYNRPEKQQADSGNKTEKKT